MHQGEIGIVSRLEEGSEFFFVLPFISEPTPAATASAG
jgi:hypothetical protein